MREFQSQVGINMISFLIIILLMCRLYELSTQWVDNCPGTAGTIIPHHEG